VPVLNVSEEKVVVEKIEEPV